MADVGINPAAWTDPRMMLANQLMQQSTQEGPLQSWTQVLARALSGPIGAYEATKVRDDRTQALSDVYGGGGAQGAQSQPGLFQRIGNFFSGDSSQPQSSGTTSGSPGSASTGPQTTGTPSGQAPAAGGTAGTTSGAPSPIPSPSQAQAGQAPAPQASSQIPNALAQQIYTARRMMQVGQERGQPDLVQTGAAMLQNIQQKLAEGQIQAQSKLLEGGYVLGPDGQSVTALGGKSAIDAAAAAAKDAAENPALIARAGGIAKAETPYKIQQALAPKQFDLQTATQTVQTPGGPRLMTNAQAMAYAQTGVLPGGANPGTGVNPDGTAATGALQDQKVKDAQIAEVTASSKRFADAQSRLQNLNQIMPILTNPNLTTGLGGDQINDLKSGILTAYRQMGVTPPADLANGVANAASLKALANNLAIEVGKDEGTGTPRVSIFNAISQNKPGLATSPEGNVLRVLAMQQSAKREADFGNFAATYYQQPGNYNKQDAEQAFAKLHPVNEYSSQIMPSLAKDPATGKAIFDAMPVGQPWVDKHGNLHFKGAPDATGAPAPGAPAPGVQ